MDRWIRRLVVVVGLMAPVQLASQLLALPLAVLLLMGGVWSIGIPVAAVLLAVRFKQAEVAATPTAAEGGAVRTRRAAVASREQT